MLISSSIVAFVCLLQFTTFAHELPECWSRCRVGDNVCLRSAMEAAMHELTGGNRDLDICSLEPFQIEELDIPPNNIIRIAQHYRNVRIYGVGESSVVSASFDLSHSMLTFKSFSPIIRFEADYYMDGRVMLVRVRGSGPCTFTLHDTEIIHVLTGGYFHIDGERYFEIKDYSITLIPKDLDIKFEGLWNGHAINAILNAQWRAFFGYVKHDYQEIINKKLAAEANKLFLKVPLDNIILS